MNRITGVFKRVDSQELKNRSTNIFVLLKGRQKQLKRSRDVAVGRTGKPHIYSCAGASQHGPQTRGLDRARLGHIAKATHPPAAEDSLG
jgi:hypothetical protein